jgi:hypothetical protein
MAAKKSTGTPKIKKQMVPQTITVHVVTHPSTDSIAWDHFWAMLDALVLEQIALESAAA